MLARKVLRLTAQNKVFRNISKSLSRNSFQRPLRIHDSVQYALKNEKSVLALESTIISHGMPYPQNFITACEVENIIRECDVVPATIGVLNGVIHVGMDKAQIKELATAPEAIKISRRDLPVACAKLMTGGTTVSATMLISYWCGIDVFATGGIGGVHQMGQDSMDISTDLRELGRTPVTVVSAGVKSILDIKRTLEYLETEGVTVATFSNTTDFPSFFTRTSGLHAPTNVETIEEAVSLVKAHKKLNMQSGTLLAVPIPSQYAACDKTMKKAVDEALENCRTHGIEGNAVTPFILEFVNKRTGGQSLKANIALIKHNARVGANIAKGLTTATTAFQEETYHKSEQKQPVIIGGCNIDIVSKCTLPVKGKGPSNAAVVTQSFGGVGHNLAETLWRLKSNPQMITAVGDDSYGDIMLSHLHSMGFSHASRMQKYRTGVYNVIIDNQGEVYVAVEDSAIHQKIGKDFIQQYEKTIVESALVCLDCNISEEAINYVCGICQRYDKLLLFEPTGELIAARGFLASRQYPNSIKFMTPNIGELQSIYTAITKKSAPTELDLNSLKMMTSIVLEYVSCILVTLGERGILMGKRENGTNKFWHYKIDQKPNWSWIKNPVVNVSGAGDGFAGGFAHGILQGYTLDQSVRVGLTVAQRNLRSDAAVSVDISPEDASFSKDCWSAKCLP